jgi:predicted amidophosphoribosyltransferase
MHDLSPAEETQNCPNCGSPLQRVPTIDREAFLIICSACPFEQKEDRSEDVALTEAPTDEMDAGNDTSTHFRQLVTAYQQTSPQDALTDPLIEDLPEETRELLQQEAAPAEKEKSRPSVEDTLRQQGYLVDEDAHGVRIQVSSGSGADSDVLSPYDIVRLAANLEGGVPSGDQRAQCPKCEAIIPAGETRCQWCGEEAQPTNPSGSQDSPE